MSGGFNNQAAPQVPPGTFVECYVKFQVYWNKISQNKDTLRLSVDPRQKTLDIINKDITNVISRVCPA